MHLPRNLLKKNPLEDFLFATLCVALALALRLALFPYETYDYSQFPRPLVRPSPAKWFPGFQDGVLRLHAALSLPALARHLSADAEALRHKVNQPSRRFRPRLCRAAPGQAQIRPAPGLARGLRGRSLRADQSFSTARCGVSATPSTRRSCSRRSTAFSGTGPVARSFSSPSPLPSSSRPCFSFRFSSSSGPKGSCR